MKTTLETIIGKNIEDKFLDFDLTEIQEVLANLQNIEPIDLIHAEQLQQKCLRAADIISEYLGKLVKTVSHLESKVNRTKNKAALNYTNTSGEKLTMAMRQLAGECADEVEALEDSLAMAKGSKVLLDKKYDLILKSHYLYKEIAAGYKKSIVGNFQSSNFEKAEGW